MKFVTFALLLFTACSPGVTPADAPPKEGPSPEATRPREIYIDDVTAGNPVVIRGRARTFENNVVLRVLDENGDMVTEDYTTSSGDIGHHNPFIGEVWLTRHPGKTITAQAFEYSAKDGAVRSLESQIVPFGVEPITVSIVVPDGDCTRFRSEQRVVPKTQAMARLIGEVLLTIPSFPRGSEIRKVTLDDGTLTIDFNERLQNVGGSCAATAIRESVTRTLKQLPTVREVIITAAGSKDLALQP
jgi:hypothetical protein